MSKLESVQQWTNDNKVDFTYISNPKTIQYLTGYFNDPEERIMALVVFPDQDPFMFAPSLQVEEIENSPFSGDVYGYVDSENPWSIIAKQVKQRVASPQHIGYEADDIAYGKVQAIVSAIGGGQFDHDITPTINAMQMIKTPDEIREMEAAGREADFSFEVGFNAVKVGVTENQISAEIKYALMQRGVMFNSFPTLVQAGAHASQPHNFTSENKVQNDELVLFDLGTVHNGYCSDASRTVAVGKPDAEKVKIYNTVKEAELTALEAAKPGMTAGDLDHIARKIIDDAGYGKYFIHRLGHGIGLSTHEAPEIKEGNDLVLKEGMCFSIEPGIYVPGLAGCRIEDCVHLTKDGAVPFTHTPTELKYID